MAFIVIQIRRGNSGEWANENPVLAQGELGIELDTGVMKFGDGINPWLDRPEIGGGGGSVNSVNGHTGDVTLTYSDLGGAPPSSGIQSEDIATIDVVTQAEYDALATKEPSTLYVIQG